MSAKVVAFVSVKPGQEDAFVVAARDLAAARPSIIVAHRVEVAD